MYFFFGLGNPDPEFKKTPHNLGFEILDFLKDEYQGTNWRKKNLSSVSRIFIENEEVVLIKPLTYMNLSGNSVKKFIEEGDLKVENCLVIFDDINLPAGTLRLKLKGSSGGHKGMESIINVFGTREIPRLRIGTGPKIDSAIVYVLTPFSKENWKKILEVFPKIKEGLKMFLKDKESAMQFLNTKLNNENKV